MDSSITAKPRRQVSLIASLAILVMFVSGLFTGTVPLVLTIVGVVIALAAWGYGLSIVARMRQTDWLAMLVISLLLALGALAVSLVKGGGDSILAGLQVGGMTFAFIVAGYASLGGAKLMERGVAAFFGGWGLLSLVIGGTLVGGAIGTTIGAASTHITDYGFRLYMIAGLLGLLAWIVGLVVGLRTQAWGWFALIVGLPAIGAFMFGLFGPSRQDVIMAQENERQRKAVGLN